MVPYKKEGVDALLAEMARELEKQQAEDDDGMPQYEDVDAVAGPKAYLEGEDDPVALKGGAKVAGGAKQRKGGGEGELVEEYIGYPQPHNVQKSPTELGAGRGAGNFENPYGRQRDYPEGSMDGGTYDRRRKKKRRKKKRKKRGAEFEKKYWAIHRLMATGEMIE